MKRFFLLAVGILYIQSLFAQIPDGYYDTADGLSGDALKAALHDIIDGHNAGSYDLLWTILPESDEDPNNTNNFILLYTGRSIPKTSVYPDYNREHVWAKSHGDFGTSAPAGTDAHHLRPTDVSVNGDRDSKDFDEGGTQHSEATECYYTSNTWEPRDAVKGDVARMMFYMATRYEGDVSGEPDLELVDYITDPTASPIFGKLSTLLKWHNEDPVDDIDRHRNEVVYSYQHNRNPFIDHPEYVAQIWGGDGVFISNVEYNPIAPTSSDDVSINATITSSGGTITTANLKWGTTTGTYTEEIVMTNSGDIYSGIIPLQTNGTTVYFIIEAEDDNAQSSSSTEYNYTIDDNASTIIIEEDFSSCPASGWITYSVASNKDWTCGSGYESINAYGGDVASDDWLITPAQNLDSYDNEVLTFKTWTQYFDTNYPSVELKYSTDYSGSGNPTAASWTNLTATWAVENSQVSTSSGDIDLSGISGSSVYFAFHYISTGTASGSAAMWRVDDILITGQESVSGVPQITGVSNSPLAPTDEEAVTISATITDDGTIFSTKIKWGVTPGDYSNTDTMTYSGSEDIYTGIISAQAKGTTVYYVIEATDNDATTNRCDENSFTVALNELPQITNVFNSPLAPTEGEDVTVSATVTDSDGTISLVEIKWGTSKGSFDNSVTMTYSGSDDIYNGTIVSQAGGTIISYVIEATDNDDDSNRSDEYSFSFNTEGNEIPEITNVDFDPTSPQSEDVVTVSATITDADGTISSASVKWGLVSGTYPNIVSTTNSGDTYSAEIPAQINGTQVYFIVYALDEDGGSAKSEEIDYLVEDVNYLPEISNVVFDPESPESTDNVRVSAAITDSDGTINSATLKWGTSTGTYPNEINMTVTSADSYISDSNIPAQQVGTVVYIVIDAEDNEAGVTESTEYSYTVVDPVNQAPIISDVLINPLSPTESDNVSVSASATDSDGSVKKVILKWKRGTGEYTEVSMNLSGGKWYGLIPKQSTGETIYYSIIAEDNEGLQGSYTSSYEISESIGIEILTKNNVNIYPNPASQYLFIGFNDFSGMINVKVFDLIGVVVLNKQIEFTNQYNLNISNLDSGIYFINFEIDNVLITKRIIIKK